MDPSARRLRIAAIAALLGATALVAGCSQPAGGSPPADSPMMEHPSDPMEEPSGSMMEEHPSDSMEPSPAY